MLTSAVPTVHRWEGEAFVWLLEFWPITDLEVSALVHKIVEGSSGRHWRRRLRVRFALPWTYRAIVTAWAREKRGGEMATDLKVSVRRQINRLRKELAVATEQLAALQG